MGIDSKLFVTCNKEDVLEMGNKVAKALDNYSREVLDNYWKNNTDAHNRIHFLSNDKYKEVSKRFTNGVSIHSYNFDTFVFKFGSGDEMQRMLYMFPTCSDDYNDVEISYKVVFSIGFWGKSDEIMMSVADAIKDFGNVYYDIDDCDDEGFVEVGCGGS